ncbi:TPR-like protein [Rhizoctonia solani]|uniref:TPR-like protein n=1 Tax=Rhizoctonia solani TaxID=456999 RepID=A0A8H7LZQ4_9AGAM|nr:TPR-like protein [Rhizoctonia solani]
MSAARYGPIVVINCYEDRCDALVILPGQDNIQHIPLPNFSQEKGQSTRIKMEHLIRSNQVRDGMVKRRPVVPIEDFDFESLLAVLWYDIVKPVLDHLGYLVLIIGQANTPGQTELPGTDEELEYVKKHIQGKANISELVGSAATKTNVLDAITKHDWVHFACHAHQNVQDPTMSEFFLYDDTLDLVSINRKSLKGKGLAFLSACQTATGDEKLPDEAIHLASGMLMAGYSSVIGTMWPVGDQDAPFVSNKVYDQLMKERIIGNGEAGRALHNAIFALRGEIGEKEFGRWAPFIHIGL